jgi:hypothetical protein
VLETFDDKWGACFPVIRQAWLNAWEYVTPILGFPPTSPRSRSRAKLAEASWWMLITTAPLLRQAPGPFDQGLWGNVLFPHKPHAIAQRSRPVVRGL